MNEREFQINGVNYRLSKVNAMKQFHLVRKLGPLLGELMPVLKNLGNIIQKEELKESDKFEAIAEIATPLFVGLSKLSDKDSEFIINGLLSTVEMQQENNYFAFLATDKGLMFQNIELPTMLQVAGRALMYNIGNFFVALPSASLGGKSPQGAK